MRNQIEDEKPHQESTRGKSSLVGPLLPAGDSLSGRIKQADGRLEGREFDSKLGSRRRPHLIQKTPASLSARYPKRALSGKSVSVRLALGGRRIFTKKKHTN